MVNEFLPSFPRKLGIPEQIVLHTKKEFWDYFNRINGKVRKIYVGLYSCDNHGQFNDLTAVDKISFDLDNHNSQQNALKISDYCMRYNYRHFILFSTRGFWVHILADDSNTNPKIQALINAQKSIINEIGLTGAEVSKSDMTGTRRDIDYHSVLNYSLNRTARMPFSFDLDRGLYAISLKRSELKSLTYTQIQELASKPRHIIYWYGSGKVLLRNYLKLREKQQAHDELNDITFNKEINLNTQIKLEKVEKSLKNFPICILEILHNVNNKGNWKGRWLFTLYAKERGLPPEITDKLAKKYFSKVKRTDRLATNYSHYKRHKVIQYVYKNDSLLFPNCETMQAMGFCVGLCRHYNSLYK